MYKKNELESTTFLNRVYILLIILVVSIFMAYIFTANLDLNKKNRYNKKASIIANNIIKTIQHKIDESASAVNFLAFALKTTDYKTDDFQKWAKTITKNHEEIENLQLAKDGIISNIYPYNDHRDVLGHNLLKDKKRNNTAIETIKRNKIIFAGPLKLIQNNKHAIIARKPIFKDKNKKEFWGFVTSVIYIEDILDSVKDLIKHNNFEYQLLGFDLDNHKIPIIFQSNDFDKYEHKFNFKLELPYTKWNLILAHDKQNQINYLIYLFSIIVGLSIYFLIDKNERKILKEKNRFENMFLSHSSIMLLIEPKTETIINCNKSAQEFYGYTNNEFIGLKLNRLTTKSNKDIKTKKIEILQKRINSFITKHKLKDGTIKDVKLNIAPIKTNNNTFLFAIITDITYELSLQKELIQTNKLLENRIKTRLEELRQKDKLLIQQSRHVAMGEMLSMIAHQWRQPLTLIATKTDKIKVLSEMELLTNKQISKSHHEIREVICHLSNTINDFSDFFKDNNKTETIYLKTLLEKSISLKNYELEKYNIKLNIDYSSFEEEILEIKVSLFTQVLLNLFSNTIDEFKKNVQKNPVIQITIYKNTNKISILFEDNAGGIKPEIINRVFEPYFSTKNKNGTGIGLYMSKIIMEEQLNGSIEVRNIDNRAIFKLSFPINLKEEDKNV